MVQLVVAGRRDLPAFRPDPHAMALVKMACSVCPVELLHECQPSIDWLMGRINGAFTQFPVLEAFTPGPASHLTDRIVLLQRKVDAPIPYFWVVVSFANFQLQTFVPGCPSDTWFRKGRPATVKLVHYPVQLPEPWPFESPEYRVDDWSGTEPVRRTIKATLNLISAKVVRPGED